MSKKLYFKWGPMNTAKSLLLITTAHNIEENGLQLMVLKPSIDSRDGSDIIKSRAGIEKECVTIDPDTNLYSFIKAYKNVLSAQFLPLKWVLIDECQFLTEEQVDQLSDVVDFLDINVMCFGLRTDFKSKLFPGSKRLFEIADDIEEIKATCQCGDRKTSINARIDENGNIITEGSQVMIGGNETYKSLCRKCWKEKIREQRKE